MSAAQPHDRLAPIRARFRVRMEAALTEIAALARNSGGGQIREQAHKLAGVAGTLGYEAVGHAAARVDAIDDPSPDHPAVADLVVALQDALAQGEPS